MFVADREEPQPARRLARVPAPLGQGPRRTGAALDRVRRTPEAAADDRWRSGRLIAWSPTIGSPACAGRMAWKPPTGSAWAIWIVLRLPPIVLKRRISSACVSMVMPFTTRRPPQGSAAHAASIVAVRGRAAADENGIRPGQTLQRGGRRRRSTIDRSGTPSDAALRAIRPARTGSRSIAIARFDGRCQHPFDADGPGAGADVPQQLALARRQRGQRHARMSCLVS